MVADMYIYELPFDVNKQLCSLLDDGNLWKVLAVHMKYSPLDISEIAQKASRHQTSPTEELFTNWSRYNHPVSALYVLLHDMKHGPAMKVLKPLIKTLHAQKNNLREKDNRSPRRENGGESSLPLQLIEPICSPVDSASTQPDASSNGIEPNSSSDDLSSTQSDTSSNIISKKIQRIRARRETVILIRQKIATIHKLSYEELTEIINNWSSDNLLGKGGFAKVYKGDWIEQKVAVKLLDPRDNLNKEFISELRLNTYRHNNLVPLYAYSLGGPEACLVYQLMVGGTLQQRLYNKTSRPPLIWPQRHRIAHDVAKGLQFLHAMDKTPLIHGDIKPANILLDHSMVAKIGDFGLSRRGLYGPNETHLQVSSLRGTEPYLPMEYRRWGFLSPKLDVFSFGVVLMEMATREPPGLHSKRPGKGLRCHVLNQSRDHDLATLEDIKIRGTPFSNPQHCRSFIELGLRCTEDDRHHRPTMLEVYKQLDAMNMPASFNSSLYRHY